MGGAGGVGGVETLRLPTILQPASRYHNQKGIFVSKRHRSRKCRRPIWRWKSGVKMRKILI